MSGVVSKMYNMSEKSRVSSKSEISHSVKLCMLCCTLTHLISALIDFPSNP